MAQVERGMHAAPLHLEWEKCRGPTAAAMSFVLAWAKRVLGRS